MNRIVSILFGLLLGCELVAANEAPANSDLTPRQIRAFESLVTSLRQNYESQELLESAGLKPSALQIQEEQLVRQIVSTIRRDPRFFGYQNGSYIAAWLRLPAASQAENRWIFSALIGRFMISKLDSYRVFNLLNEWGLRPQISFWFIEARNANPESLRGISLEQWVLSLGQQWLQEQRQHLLDPVRRDSTHHQLVQLAHKGFRYPGLYEFVLRPLPLDVRFDLIELTLGYRNRLTATVLLPLFLNDIDLRVFLRQRPELFRRVIADLARNTHSASGFFKAYGPRDPFTRDFLQSRWKIFPTQASEGSHLHFVTDRAEGLTVAQQLLLYNQAFRDVIWNHLIPELDQQWARDLIDWSFAERLPQGLFLGAAMAVKHVMDDPRWASWMSQLDADARRMAVLTMAEQRHIYQVTSEHMLAAHRLILPDLVWLRIRGDDRRPLAKEGLALDLYLSEAMKVPILRESHLLPALPEVFSRYYPEVWKPFLQEVVIPMQRAPDLNSALLDILHGHRINDLATLRLLNRAFGIPEGFVEDLRRAPLDTVLEAELRSLAFDQAYFLSAQAARRQLKCLNVFAL